MSASVKTLRRPDAPATDDELHAAALQFVRKISGYRRPSRANEQAFNQARERDRPHVARAAGFAGNSMIRLAD